MTLTNLLIIFLTFTAIVDAQSHHIFMKVNGEVHIIATNSQFNPLFYQTQPQLDCAMPQLFILEDNNHSDYTIETEGVEVYSIEAQWATIESYINCNQQQSCVVSINNQCSADNPQINWIKLKTSIGEVEYFVNCDPDSFYKPFQIGLFLLIILCAVTVTLSGIYSRAWSYGGWGYSITKRIVITFIIIVLVGMVWGYFMPDLISIIAQVLGSIIGAGGVTVCLSETLWLFHYPNFMIKLYKKFRLLDLICILVGIAFMALYWLFDGQWFLNDIMAVCSIVALMKLLKLRSLSTGVFLQMSLLVLEVLVGLVVHYVFKMSYNNYIINLFQNPIILVMPSITPQLYRRCAWLPITSILFPGLLLSYLRRFDASRSTHIYFIIGLVSFYTGSFLWMLIDMETVHSLPFAIISEPITLIIICLMGLKRNEFKVIWKGTFYDQEVTDTPDDQNHIKETQIMNPTAYGDLINNLRLADRQSSSQNYQVME